jgi:hypothetical protein
MDKRRAGVMGKTDEASAARQAAPWRSGWPHPIDGLGRLAGGSAVDGPLGLLAVAAERLAADRHLTTAKDRQA